MRVFCLECENFLERPVSSDEEDPFNIPAPDIVRGQMQVDVLGCNTCIETAEMVGAARERQRMEREGQQLSTTRPLTH